MNKDLYLVEGAITNDLVANYISRTNQTNNGAHSIFLGQVRNDIIDNKEVKAIEYSAYSEMVKSEMDKLVDLIKTKYDDVHNIIVKHSIGIVKTGEVSLFVLISSGHRKQAFSASKEFVDLIKEHIPIWKKEMFSDKTHVWK